MPRAVLLRLCMALSLAWVPAGFAKPLTEYSLSALKKFLVVRGADCAGCDGKEDYLARAEAIREWPVDATKKRAHEEGVAYRKKARQFNMSRDDFLHQMNESESEHPLEGARAERLWRRYQEQLRDGRVDFVNGSVRFTMPITHKISPYIHPLLADMIERAFDSAHSAYVMLPPAWRAWAEQKMDWLVETRALHALVFVLLSIVLIDLLLEHLRGRRPPPTAEQPGQPAASSSRRKHD
eukprot:CAMPEP_0183346402 /NCGR_PEP_ID=MMETSP0164_2-20130417/11537_1 /TAXON_ID=221442 /ORGANISM="Coccolithus pelagicus ssp braarudi, Strain PLY182g" /LENGTH=237 /DNA_ID=CAMNT_0025517675 /DNA_START=58 /DNA_END=771 /DNA_ORIENTATION=-